MKLAIVIPTYNEAETIPNLIRELFDKIKQLVEKLDVLIIDDSSPVGTADKVRGLDIVVVVKAMNKDHSYALLEKMNFPFIKKGDN